MRKDKDGCGGKGSWGFECLIRRKQVDTRSEDHHHQLAKTLSLFDLISIGVGSTIGAGVYILVGTVAREYTGPALTICFLIAGIAAALSAFCYAELASHCPSAGSAYHYTYICLGEGVAWLIGWALILDYTVGGSAVARSISPNVALFFGGEDNLPVFIARHTIMGIVVDPCGAILFLVVTGILCTGIKESSLAQGIVTTINVCALLFVIIAGGYLGFKTGWAGYELPSRLCPFGVSGMLTGSATVFFSYIGFDSITSTAEEVKNPQRDLPLGMGISLSMCCCLYMLVSAVIVGLVPYYELDPDTPISSAFANYGMEWTMYIITTGAVTALMASLIGGVLPQPRILMAMARDGLLPPFFSEINEHTQVPVKGTIVTGIFGAALAFFMDVSQLAGMVSAGTLLAFTTVAISLLILRYVSPYKVPLPPSLQESIYSVASRCSSGIQDSDRPHSKHPVKSWDTNYQHSLDNKEALLRLPLIQKEVAQGEQNEERRHKVAAWNIALVCIGILVLTSAASAEELCSISRFTLCGVGGVLLLCGMIVLSCIDQDGARHNFGHTGGFSCPFVPFLPVACILINTYLLINLGGGTWIRVAIWLVAGALLYAFYGRTHSSLSNAIYVPASHVDEIYRNISHQI